MRESEITVPRGATSATSIVGVRRMIPDGITVEQEMEYWRNWRPSTTTKDGSPAASAVVELPVVRSFADTPEYTKLRQSGFTTWETNEAQAQIGKFSSVIIEQDTNEWHTYRIHWHEDGRLQTYKTLYKGPDYKTAVRKACEFMSWLKTKRGSDA